MKLRALFILALVVAVAACSGPEERTFAQAMQNQEAYYNEGGMGTWYSGGVVVDVPTETTENKGYFVATYQPLPKNLTEKDVIVVKGKNPIKVGDVIRVSAQMRKAEGETEDGNSYTTYYLYVGDGSFQIVGHIDQNDPDFAKLLQQVSSAEAERRWSTIKWLVLWTYVNPLSPLSPFRQPSRR